MKSKTDVVAVSLDIEEVLPGTCHYQWSVAFLAGGLLAVHYLSVDVIGERLVVVDTCQPCDGRVVIHFLVTQPSRQFSK